MIQLTIAVPAYNAEKTLEKCLDSMVGRDERLEVIVIDDGSVDATLELAQGYVSRYAPFVRVIAKENGGHGSGINVAVKNAQGRYFKVIDADDWIVSENLVSLLDTLEQTKADAVITGYHTIDISTGKRTAFSSACRHAGRDIGLAELMEVYEEISSCCSFHGLMYRTDFYRETGIELSEGIFYEDQEYATMPFAHVDSVSIEPAYFYEYRIGDSGQSVAFHNQVARIGHIEKVILRILDYRAAQGPLRPEQEAYFLRKLSVIVVSYFAVALVKDTDRRKGKENAKRFYAELEHRAPDVLRMIDKKYRTLWVFHALRIPAQWYQNTLNTAFYKRIRQIWTN